MFPKIFIKVFISTLILIVVFLLFVFTFFIPNVEKNTIKLEEKIGEVQLQKTLQIVQSTALEMESYKKTAIEEHKTKLKNLTETAWCIIAAKEKESRGKSKKEIVLKQKEVLKLISELHYNTDDYFFVSDYQSKLISHPYLEGTDFSNIKDLYGNLIVPPMINIARKQGEGFTSYWWKKNNSDDTIYEKLSYVKNFAQWKWIIGTGVYIDNIDKDIEVRKSALIARLKDELHDTKIGETGYVYIFNAKSKMIIHPDKSLEGKIFNKRENPGTNGYIFQDLVNAYKSGDKKLYYLWDREDDRGNFIYEKISWIEYDPYFDWYICSSGYLNEFRHESESLKEYILYAASFMTIFITILGLYFLRQILNPIIRLSQNARDVIDGNLDVRYTGTINNDETGILATQFNLMLETINKQIDTLDLTVQEKTKELSSSLEEKDILLKEIHHRVKNNLFVISGIIGLQAFNDKEISTNELIKSIQERIHAIALAHEMLCKKEAKDEIINIDTYVQKLVNNLLHAYVKDSATYSCIYDIEPVELSLDQILSCGLIVNELVTNATKYAFKDKEDMLKISLHLDINNYVVLDIQDNGDGFKDSNKQGIGLELVEISVKQLGGSMKISSNNGAHINIRFPK